LSYYRIALSSFSPLSLLEKKEYIDSMFPASKTYQEKHQRNQGFLLKFNHSIGFKKVSSWVDNTGICIEEEVESPENYLNPKDLLLNHMYTPVEGAIILSFELPKQKMKHSKQQFSYHTKEIANKWTSFLQKVFPHLQCEITEIEHQTTLSLKDYALQYFYQCIEKSSSCTIEFSSETYLTNEEKKDILTYLQPLSDEYILDIGQYNCSTCAGYSNGQKPIHIELVYLEKNRYAI